MGQNTHLVMIVCLYLVYKHGLPRIQAWRVHSAVSSPEQKDKARRFLDALTAGQCMQVQSYLTSGYDVGSVVDSLGCARFEVLRLDLADTLRANPDLYREAMANKV